MDLPTPPSLLLEKTVMSCTTLTTINNANPVN